MAVNPDVWGVRAGRIIAADGTIVDEAKAYDNSDPNNPAKRVSLSGAKLSSDLMTSTPLAAGAAWGSGWQPNPDGGAIGFVIKADTVVQIKLDFAGDASGADNAGSDAHYNFVVDPASLVGGVWVPPIRTGPYYIFSVTNPTANAQTRLAVYRVIQHGGVFHRQSLRQVLAYGLAPRDTSTHDLGSDPQTAFLADLAWVGDGTRPIFVKNGTDQEITVDLKYTADAAFDALLGTFTVAAGALAVKTNADFPGLDVPAVRVSLAFTPSVAPTAGSISAFTVSSVGG